MKARIAGLALALAFCVAPTAAFAADCPGVGLEHRKAVFVTKSGRHAYDLEVAATADQQSCGMMFRRSMKPATGMIFPFSPPRPAAFWMENTYLPLDLIFIGPDSRVLTIASGKPLSRDLIDSGGVTASVIELRAGEAKRIGLKPGDRVE
jgi:uncharacterized membrane protein (UPF0127 family)